MANSGSAMTFGELLKRHRLARGFSQEVLAERARMSVAAIGALERGVRKAPYRDTFVLLADALALSAEDRAELDVAASQARRRVPRRDATLKVKHNLPTRLTSFVGRDEELAHIADLLRKYRIVTLTGSGGVGKTRVAVEAAKRLLGEHYDEAWFVDLAPVENGTFLAGAIAAVVDAPLARVDDPMRALATQLKSRRFLLLLDNCEHVIADAAEAAAAIARTCPDITVLATSRERLGIEGERPYRLPSLPLPPTLLESADEAFTYAAFQLFIDRAEATGPKLVIASDRLRSVAAICQQLEGIPLAIELAATLVATLGTDALQKHLSQHFVIAGGNRDLPQRQRSMLATINWSYGLLSEQEQAFLRRLAIFRGGATIEAMTAVIADAGIPVEVIPEIVSRLVNKSLLALVNSNEPTRYTMLESVRSFARSKLVEAQELTSIARAHATWLAVAADRSEAAYREMSQILWLRERAAEIDNIRSALEWATSAGTEDDALLAARIVGGFRGLWITGRRFTECRHWLAATLPRIDAERHPHIAARLVATQIQVSEAPQVLAAASDTIALFERIGDRKLLMSFYAQLAHVQASRQDFVGAEHSLVRAFELADEQQLRGSRKYADLLEVRGGVRFEKGDTAEAKRDFAEVARLRGAGPDNSRLYELRADIEFRGGHLTACVALLEEGLAECRAQFEDASAILSQLTAAYLALGEVDAAAKSGIEALELTRFEPQFAWWVIWHLAPVISLRGRPAEAVRLAGFAAAISDVPDPCAHQMRRSSRDILMSSARKHLTPEMIATLSTEGAALDFDRAVDEALNLLL
jgi:predicted ATPase